MYENMECLLHNIRGLYPRVDCDQMRIAVASLSKCNGNNPVDMLENLYDDLLCGIPLRQTSIGKVMCYMFA